MMKSPITYFVGSVILAGGLGWLIKSDKLSLGPVDKIFKADELTPADYEEMHIERSGSTLDYVPQSLSESFMGYQYLDLEHTTMVANDLPFGPVLSIISIFTRTLTISDTTMTPLSRT